MNWWQLVLDLLPLSWLLIPAPAVLFAPTQAVRPVSIGAAIFYAALIIVGFMTEEAVCRNVGVACLFALPIYLLGAILTGIAFVIRASGASRKR